MTTEVVNTNYIEGETTQDIPTNAEGSSSLLKTLVILVVSLIAAVLALAVVLILRLKSQSQKDRQNRK